MEGGKPRAAGSFSDGSTTHLLKKDAALNSGPPDQSEDQELEGEAGVEVSEAAERKQPERPGPADAPSRALALAWRFSERAPWSSTRSLAGGLEESSSSGPGQTC
ncbi:unnamed protein product [Rangifer tarandus platyrhynchus]|uniref:Uncharacterized protein n=1 Tax=Rangifer tarandus platyrhynchus TaxID=3082113 RepID=A0ACB1MJR0_RANTA